MVTLLPRVIYDSDNVEYFLNIYTEPRFMKPDKYEYVFAYISADEGFAVKIQNKHFVPLMLSALKWMYGRARKSWELKIKK